MTVGIIVFMAPSATSANTMTQTLAYGGYTNWSYGFVFNQFNTSLGTLNSVTVESTGVLNTMSATFTDNSTTSETLTYFQEVFQASLTGPNSTNLTASSSLPALGPVTLGPLGSGNNGTSESVSNVPTDLGSSTYTSSLGAFEGNSTVTFTGNALAGENFSGDSNINWSATTQATQTVDLIYNYTPGVPEPVSLVLSGSGLALLALVRRRRPARTGNQS